jgi:serine phosphatase RsbU (regulator of sigma subunit)/anti-sigma regulatory factor (Ser/Thr protein kinase)
VEIAPDDALVDYLQNNAGIVEVDRLRIDSPAVTQLKAAGVKIAVPLVSQGELVGILNLGSRLSEQEYSTEDLGLMDRLAFQAAPAVRVAQLARLQQVEVRERERLEQELRVASVIQQTLLPQSVPEPPGWKLSAHYQPAREVGGDFYDFLDLPDGRLGLVVGDVTDKGVPAALVMATTRAILRSAAERLVSPGHVLQRANELLYPDIPAKMFVTCLYAVLDPKDGRLQVANAGQDLPFLRNEEGIQELRATGMPLGLMPGMTYEQEEIVVKPGDSVLMYSDGLVEAHDEHREMFGLPRLTGLVRDHEGGPALIEFLLGELSEFTGKDAIQEDDVTMVTLQRIDAGASKDTSQMATTKTAKGSEWRKLLEFELPSEPGNERQAMERVAGAVDGLGLPADRLERLKTAVAEATMNAMEHGNQYNPDLPATIRVDASKSAIAVKITDHGGGDEIVEPEAPDLESKLAGLQSPRGWGLFLIREMVDELSVSNDDIHHTIRLVMRLTGGDGDS